MWVQWLSSFPDVRVLPLDVGTGAREDRRLPNVPWLAQQLLTADERTLLLALGALAKDDFASARDLLRAEVAEGCRHPDVRFLAAACELRSGNCPAAVELLAELYLHNEADSRHPAVGNAIRHVYPALRCLARITPTQLLPVYPSPYGTALLYAVALDACGQSERALTVLREMVPPYGLLDELRVMAARIHLGLGNIDQALEALTHAECSEPDALEFTRSFYLAYCHYLQGDYRLAGQTIGRVVRTLSTVSPHSLARARLLLAECYGRCGLLLDALRESGMVEPELLPADVATLVLAREERWLGELTQLSPAELEVLSDADIYQVYIPEPKVPRGSITKLDTSYDPMSKLQPKAMSWAERKREVVELAQARAAFDRGEPPPAQFQAPLSSGAVVLVAKIKAAQEWWPGRRLALQSAPGKPEVSNNVMAQAPQQRFDFHGHREPSLIPLTGERRAVQSLTFAGAVVAIAGVLTLLHGCATW